MIRKYVKYQERQEKQAKLPFWKNDKTFGVAGQLTNVTGRMLLTLPYREHKAKPRPLGVDFY